MFWLNVLVLGKCMIKNLGWRTVIAAYFLYFPKRRGHIYVQIDFEWVSHSVNIEFGELRLFTIVFSLDFLSVWKLKKKKKISLIFIPLWSSVFSVWIWSFSASDFKTFSWILEFGSVTTIYSVWFSFFF